MTTIATNNVLIDGFRIAYSQEGSGTPVLLIHGTPSSSFLWREVAPSLVRSGCEVLVPDLLGYGASERPVDATIDTSVSGQVPVLLRLLDHCGFDQVHVVAHDIGGAVAQRLAIYHRERVVSLTLIDSVCFDSWPAEHTRKRMQAGIPNLASKPDAEHRSFYKDWLLTAVHDKQNFLHGALDRYIENISGLVGQASFFQHQVKHYDPRHTIEISDRLQELADLPTQILWGAEDAWQHPDWANKLHQAIPNSELHFIPDCGHFSPEDQPQTILSFIDNHIRKHG